MQCKMCGIQVDKLAIIDQHGARFCSEVCVDNCETYDDHHPYYFDYVSIRGDYLEWQANWQAQLEKDGNEGAQQAANAILDDIDERVANYADYVWGEGSDGAFAREVYLYTLKFRDLQKQILAWRPQRESFSIIEECSSEYGSGTAERIWPLLEEVLDTTTYKDLYEYAHSWKSDFTIMFDWSLEVAYLDELVAKINKAIEPIGEVVWHAEAIKCDGGCGEFFVTPVSTSEFSDGWLVCYDCERNKALGTFTKEQLLDDLAFYANEPNELAKLLSGHDWKECYLPAVRRACREHDVECPSWASIQ